MEDSDSASTASSASSSASSASSSPPPNLAEEIESFQTFNQLLASTENGQARTMTSSLPTDVFYTLFLDLISDDPVKSEPAEIRYESIPLHEKALHLWLICKQQISTEIRKAALELLFSEENDDVLSNAYANEEVFAKWSTETLDEFCDDLIRAVQTEPDENLRSKFIEVCARVAVLRKNDDDDVQSWLGIVSFIENSGETVATMLSALKIIIASPNVFGNESGKLFALLNRGILHDEKNIQEHSLKATKEVLARAKRKYETEAHLSPFSPLIPSFVKIVDNDGHSMEHRTEAFSCLAMIVMLPLTMFLSLLSDIFNLCSKMVSNDNTGLRHYSLDTLRELLMGRCQECIDSDSSLGVQDIMRLSKTLLMRERVESNSGVRHYLEDVLGEVIKFRFDNFASSEIADNLEALTFLRDNPRIFGTHIPTLAALFPICLHHEDDSIRTVARASFITFATCIAKWTSSPMLRDALKTIYRPVVLDLISNDGNLTFRLQILEQLAGAICVTFKYHKEALVLFCHEVITNNAYDERRAALRLLTTVVERFSTMPDYPIIVSSYLTMMAKVNEDLSMWLSGNDPEEEKLESPIRNCADLGSDCFEKVAGKSKVMSEEVLLQAETLLEDDDWKKRQAALRALGAIGGKWRTLDILQRIMPYLKDSHPRVVEQACQAINGIGQSSREFNDHIYTRSLQSIVPVLIDIMRDTAFPFTADMAASAICHFKYPQHISAALLDKIVDATARQLSDVSEMTDICDARVGMSHAQLSFLSSLLKTLTGDCAVNLADFEGVEEPPEKKSKSEEPEVDHSTLITTLYASLIDPLTTVLHSSSPSLNTKYWPPRASSFELIVMLVVAVGKEKFSCYANQVLSDGATLLTTLDPEDCYLILDFLPRLIDLLGTDVVPSLNLLIPALFRVARFPTDSALDEFDRSFFGYSYARKSLKIISDFAVNFEDQFLPWVDSVSKLSVESLEWDDECTLTLYHLLYCTEDTAMRREMWTHLWTSLKAIIARKSKADLVTTCIGLIQQCIYALGKEIVSKEDLAEIGRILEGVMTRSHKDRKYGEIPNYYDRDDGRTEVNAEKSEDPFIKGFLTCRSANEWKEKKTGKHVLYKKIHFLVLTMLEDMGGNSFSVVNSMIPIVVESMAGSVYGIKIIVDFVKNAPELALTHYDSISAHILSLLSHRNTKMRCEAVRSLRDITSIAIPHWTSFVVRALPSLYAIISRPGAKKQCYVLETAMAMASAAVIIKQGRISPSFLQWISDQGTNEASGYVFGVFREIVNCCKLKCEKVVGVEYVDDSCENYPLLRDIINEMLKTDAFETCDEGKELKKSLGEIVREIEECMKGEED